MSSLEGDSRPAPVDGASAGPAGTPEGAPADGVTAGEVMADGESPSGIRRRAQAAKERYSGSTADTVWQRLSALDFINQAMQFAAILLLCFLPFLIIVGALAGHSVVEGLSRHLGLNHEASGLVGQLFYSSSKTSNAVTVQGIIFTIFGGIGTAATLQAIYERLFGLPSRGMKDFHRQLMWIGATVGLAAFAGWVGHALGPTTSDRVWFVLVSAPVLIAFWFFTLWILVGSRVPPRRFVAPAVATTLFWIGLGVFSKFFFSNTIIGDHREYGPIGVVFALMSWLIAIGVVIILGAVVGTVFSERDLSLYSALKRLLRTRRERS